VINVKVFWLKKHSEETETQMYRSFKEPKNISNIKIDDDFLFKYLTLTNPIDSKCIYTLHELNIKLKKNNILTLLSTDNLETISPSNRINSLQIAQELSVRPDISHMELATIKNSDSFFKSNYAILLPGGSLVIEAENTISEVALSIDWSVEEF
jgi:hypothetical protein